MTEQRTNQQKGCHSRSNIVHSDKIYVDVHSSHDKVILGCREIFRLLVFTRRDRRQILSMLFKYGSMQFNNARSYVEIRKWRANSLTSIMK